MAAQLFSSGKSREEPWQGTVKVLHQKLFSLGGLEIFFGGFDLNRTVGIFKEIPQTEPFQHSVGGGPLPVKCLLAELYQFPGGDGGVLSD